MDTVELIATVSAGHISKGEMVKSAPVTAARHIGRSAWNVMAFATGKSFCDKEMASIRTPGSSHEVRKSDLYVVLDIFSRYAVGWMVADRENSTLAASCARWRRRESGSPTQASGC